MASDEELLNLTEKISTLPSFDSLNSEDFEATYSGELTVVIRASSCYEAALKFGFMLRELGTLSKNEDRVSVEVKNKTSQEVYTVCTDKGKVSIELDHIVCNDGTNSTFQGTVDANETRQTVNFSTDDELNESSLVGDALRRYFGFETFRPLQKETIEATMSGANVLTVVGTGGGKSLMFMLPSVLASKPTLVVSPIKSLIDDTTLRCAELDIPVCYFTGDISEETKNSQLEGLEHYRIIIATPEMLQDRTRLREAIERSNLERIVFDEAHTISTWGKTFRPIYKDVCASLSKIRCPKLLLSATITARLESDMTAIFGDLVVFRNTVYRENLILEVVERSSKYVDEIAKYVKERSGRVECGIVYCVLPREVTTLHSELIKRGITAVKYHGQLSEDMKQASYSKWLNGEALCIVANASFGMGIDKANVRYVLHARLPTSVEEYSQQCGRAGRDGQPSTCCLYHSTSDKSTLFKLFYSQDENCEVQCQDLNDLITMLEDPVQCRHKALMVHFGEKRDSFVCISNCDNCVHRGKFQLTDGTTDALKVIQAVVELTGQHITAKMLKLFLAGSNQKLVSNLGHLSNFGALKKRFTPVSLLSKFLNTLIVQKVISEKVESTGTGRNIRIGIVFGPKANSIINNELTILRFEKT